jgi:hypothetical protein
MHLRALIRCSVLLVTIACSPPQIIKPGGNRPGTGASSGAMPGTGPSFTLPDPVDGAAPAAPPAGPREGMACGFQRYQLERLQPELMMVLDRSGSMLDPAADGQNSRWVETTAAVIEVLTQTEGTISWGLKSFPNPSRCLVTPEVDIEIGPSSTPAVDLVRNMLPNEDGSGTPTGQALEVATRYLRGRPTLSAKYLVLATDGPPACPPGATRPHEQRALAALADALAGGIPTFVIGIATAGSPADQILAEFAHAGGRARAGAQAYYPVEDRNGLLDALAEIRKEVASCTFGLEKDPPSPDDVAVNVDGTRIMRDPARMNGWNYNQGTRSVTLYGPVCDRVKRGEIKDVNIIFGCPHVPIP